MSLTWTIILGILASVIGGVLSGFFVAFKLGHDNKRLYANQVFDDFKFMYIELFYSILTDLESFGYKIHERIPTGPEKTDYQQTQILLDKLRRWLKSDAREALTGYSSSEVLRRADETVKSVICGEFGVKRFVDKYPLQTSYFDNVYEADSLAEYLLDNLNSGDTTKSIEESIIDLYGTMILMIDALSKGMMVIEYYRKTKSWTWRIAVPFVRK